jgi:iron complex outermembrane receptor protein
MPGLQQATSTYLFGLFGINANLPNGFYRTSGEKFATFYGLGEPKVDLWDYGSSATAVYSLDGLDLTSISAFRRNDSVYFLDGPVNSPPIVPEYIDLQKHYFYQELRATSTGEGPLQYLAGATWLTTNFNGQTVISYLPPFPAGAPTLVNDQVRDWSFYGQVGYDLTRAVNLTVSGRYITETNDARFSSPVVAGDAFKQDKFLPAATLKYTLPNANVLYARFAEGFKAGGVNPVAPPSAFPAGDDYGKVFTPETVDTYATARRSSSTASR